MLGVRERRRGMLGSREMEEGRKGDRRGRETGGGRRMGGILKKRDGGSEGGEGSG